MSACAGCGRDGGAGKMGLCPTCRLRLFNPPKYPWTPAMDDQLRQAYRSARRKRDLTAAYDRLQTQFQMPRCVIMNRAQALGLRWVKMRAWTEEELEILSEQTGSVPIAVLAKQLHRNPNSVKQYLFRKGLAGKLTEGYSASELAPLFGVSHSQIGRWVDRGLLDRSRKIEDRITHESVLRFVAAHPDEYSLRRVEEWWMKSLLKEIFAAKSSRRFGPEKELNFERRIA